MNTGQLAELIAAGFFAIGVGVACYVLLRLARLITSATEAVAEYRARADSVLAGAQAALDRASEQLARSDAITASMDDVTSNMAELSGHVSALAGLARSLRPGGAARPAARAVAAMLGPGQAVARDGVGPFLADVRDGMDEYLDRHAPRTGPTLDSQPAARPPLASPPDPPRGRPQRGRSRFNHAKDGR